VNKEDERPFDFNQILAQCEKVMDSKIDKKRKESFDEETKKADPYFKK
jgi:hypothetical protein